jgi:crossover junction endodeoxyribonuclease RuvC
VAGAGTVRIVGIDPGLVGTGFAVLEGLGARIAVVVAGVVETHASMPLDDRLHAIHDGVAQVLDAHAPGAMVLEDLYSEYRFPRTALLMAHARGVICLAARQRNIALLTLAPAEVKRAVTANGAASKAQVQHAVGHLLALSEPPRPSHVADAFALAFTGLSRLGTRGSVPERVPVIAPGRRHGRAPAMKAWPRARPGQGPR